MSEVRGQRSGKKRCWPWLIARLLPLTLLGSGCTTTSSFVSLGDLEKPTGAPCHVVAAWVPEVRANKDPLRRGQLCPGLAGRVFLFGEEIKYPLVCEGTIAVDLYDRTPGRPKSETPLEVWRFDKTTLKRLERRDAVGWGYTLVLPWSTYRPDITQVELRLSFQPVNGTPLYADSAPVTFKSDMQVISQESTHIVKPQDVPRTEELDQKDRRVQEDVGPQSQPAAKGLPGPR